jgi:UTP--glucose-1-phosphate uridylyltransferase
LKKITKAIIPAAGLGTRFLPQTKAMPKEMLPVLDKPIIQYVVEEAVAAGITDIIIVTGAHKRSIEDHFDHQYQLEDKLDDDGKHELADQLRGIAEMANFVYVRQKPSFSGNGTPILNAAHLLNDEPFLVLWADEIFAGAKPRAKQLIEAYEQLQAPVISLIPMTPDRIHSYGVPRITQDMGNGIMKIDHVVEKPKAADAPSAYASIGGYVLNSDILKLLEAEQPDGTGEVYLSAAIDKLAQQSGIYGKVLEGTWHDTGNKAKYLECIVDMALNDQELSPAFRDYLITRLDQ